MEDDWIPVSALRRGDLVVEGDDIILVISVSPRSAHDFFIIDILRNDAHEVLLRHIGTFVLGTKVASNDL